MSDSLVSVVVPTRNNERTIEACLGSVVAQTHQRVELIVVDNASTDRTVQIAARFADIVISAGPERSAQRNIGARAAHGNWLLWLDSDMVLPPEAVEVALHTAESVNAAGVALPERTIGVGFWTACRALERTCYLDDPWLHNPRFLRRDHLLELGGFDLRMSGPEDADLRLRMLSSGDLVVLAPVLVDHDEGRLTVRSVMSKRYYYGRSIPTFAAAHEGAVARQGASILRAYLRHRRRLLSYPGTALGLVGLRTLEAVAYSAGALRGRLDRLSGPSHDA